jgi:DNA polymerase III sliding clamp (beta) subunit (PCNA family)
MRAIESTLECNAADELTVKAGSATTKIKGLSAKEMPPIVEVKGGKEVSIPAEILVPFLKKSLAHTSADKSLGNLTSVSIVSRDGKMNIQATNRRHCIICETDVDLDSSDAYIIPHESVSSLIGISSGEVKMRLSLDAMSAEAESGMFATKLYEGPLPDFRMTFPKDLPTHIIVDRDKLMALVEYVEVQTTQDIQHITLSSDGVILTAKGAAGIAAPDAFVDMNQDWIQCEPGSGKFTFAVNPQFLKDAIKATEEQLITIECADPVRNVVINEGAVSIAICPIKLQ